MKLTKEAREARNKYAREWRAAHPDKVAAANERFWAKKAAQMAAENTNTESGNNFT